MKDDSSEHLIQYTNNKIWNEWNSHLLRHSQNLIDKFDEGFEVHRGIEAQYFSAFKYRKILHLFCGLGLETLSLSRYTSNQFYGVDFSQLAIDFAVDKARKHKINCSFMCQNVNQLDESSFDTKFDIIYCSYGAIEWISDLQKWVALLNNLLTPNGKVYLIDMHPFSRQIVCHSETGCHTLHFKKTGELTASNLQTVQPNGIYFDRSFFNKTPFYFRRIHDLPSLIRSFLQNSFHLEFYDEYEFAHYKQFPNMKLANSMYWEFEKDYKVPLLFEASFVKMRS
jgi:SAM-dependent methyltransferase